MIKYSSSLLAVATLCALSIWTFTPVSEEANYKPVRAKNTITKKATEATARPANVTNKSQTVAEKVEQVMLLDIQPELQAIEPYSVKLAETPETTQVAETAEVADTLSEPKLATTDSIRTLIPANKDIPLSLEVFTEPATPVTADFAAADLPVLATEAEAVVSLPTPRSADSVGSGRVETFSIKSGDTLTRIFSSAKLPISQAIKLSRNKAADRLNRLSIGKALRIYFDENSQWETLEYDTDKLNTLIVSPHQGEFIITQHEKQVEYRTFTARGTIESTLGLATENAGVSAGITQKLADIYQWEIDFARDIHVGDTFSVVYQKAYIDGELVTDGSILAASFTSNGRTIDAIRYTDSLGKTAYFQPDGASLRRGFLRTPVRLARITSGFGKRRHPIKKTWKKHLGVDYGASRGTPILATADGVVQYSGKKGGYGNAVILRHGGKYTTLYAHMSKLGKGIRSGKPVTQGQVIGYVGRSGWATGDHLHYEFRVNGQHKDPLKVKLPKTQPLAKKEMNAFSDQAEPLLGTLTSLKAAQLATLDTPEAQSAL